MNDLIMTFALLYLGGIVGVLIFNLIVYHACYLFATIGLLFFIGSRMFTIYLPENLGNPAFAEYMRGPFAFFIETGLTFHLMLIDYGRIKKKVNHLEKTGADKVVLKAIVASEPPQGGK